MARGAEAPLRRSKQRLTPELREARRAESQGVLDRREGTAGNSGELRCESTAADFDPGAAARHMRIGFFAALVLIFLLLWIRQRRKGA